MLAILPFTDRSPWLTPCLYVNYWNGRGDNAGLFGFIVYVGASFASMS